MGALDDAIREHLELRRRHGASSDEIAHKEAEALGPARREVGAEADGAEVVPIEDAAPAVEDPPPPAEPAEPAVDLPPAEPVADPSIAALEALPEDEVEAEHPPLDDAVEVEGPAPAEAELDPEAGAPVVTPDALDAAPALPSEEPHTPDTPPRGFEAVPAEPEENAEDVLEETPDFLQETPEHDRLWFEQKPPRDFDFDE